MYKEHQRSQHGYGRVSETVKLITYEVKSFLRHCKDYALDFVGTGEPTEGFEYRNKDFHFTGLQDYYGYFSENKL